MNRDVVTDASVVQIEPVPVSREAAEEAVRALLLWAGDDPAREGLFDTPRRVANAYEEFFAGYRIDPEAYLERAFEETDGYDEMVVLRDIEFVSHCEHHVVPIIGKAHVTYLPNRRVVGISKTARVVEAYTRRLQIQERRTSQIANAFERAIQPRGTAVVIEAEYRCMTTHEVKKPGCFNGNQPNARRLPRRCETTIGLCIEHSAITLEQR